MAIGKAFSGVMMALLLVTGMVAVASDLGINDLVQSVVAKMEQGVGIFSEAPRTEWSRTFGSGCATVCVQSDDGGYVLAGDGCATLLKVDSSGNQVWAKSLGFCAVSLCKTSDGGYVLLGGLNLVKTDADGNQQWARTYGDSRTYWRSVMQTSDGGYILAGTQSYQESAEYIRVLKTNGLGYEQWSNLYGGEDSDEWGFSVVEASDGGYAVAGCRGYYDPGWVTDSLLVKIDTDGEMLWDREYGAPPPGCTCALSVIRTDDDGYMLAGSQAPTSEGFESRFYLVKSDVDGNLQWNKVHGNAGMFVAYTANCVTQTVDGGYAIAGHIVYHEADDASYELLVKMDSYGNVEWEFPSLWTETGNVCSVIQTSDGGYAVAGQKDDLFWLAKLGYPAVAIYSVEPMKRWDYTGAVEIRIGVANGGSKVETFPVIVQGRVGLGEWRVLGSFSVLSLQPGSSRTCSFLWNTKRYPEGEYTIGARIDLPGYTDSEFIATKTVNLPNVGYFIIVAGKGANQVDQDYIDLTCNRAYAILTHNGFSKSRICYLNPSDQLDDHGENCVWRYTSYDNLDAAINEWAADLVGKSEPLFIYMFGHGTKEYPNSFDLTGGLPPLFDSGLASWLSNLREQTGAELYVICNFCHSGHFLDDLSPIVNVTICSCRHDEADHLYMDEQEPPRWEGPNWFSDPFWTAIWEGKSVGDAFNTASEYIGKHCLKRKVTQTPLLDDNQDCIGNTGPMPSAPDGAYAMSLHIGHCTWAFPWVSASAPAQYLSWPPTGTIELWAAIENESSLKSVRAFMIPPDLPPLQNDADFVEVECFDMTDQDCDGNYSANIPAVNFSDHASGPSSFTFVVLAEQESNMTAYPCFQNVIFTEDGQPLADTIPPVVDITRPLNEAIVHGLVVVNGTTTDDVCLQKAELYVDGNLTQTAVLPRTSSSYFVFELDTSSLANGNHTLSVNSYDESDNSASQTLTVHSVNNVHDLAVTNVDPKSIVGQGFVLTVPITIVNHGSHAESANLTLCVNSVAVEARVINDLPVDGLTTANFTWSTEGYANGNYTIDSYVDPVSGETETGNNVFSISVSVGVPGDGDGNRIVNMLDLYKIALIFGATRGSPNYVANYDIEDNGIINMLDLYTAATHFGQTDP